MSKVRKKQASDTQRVSKTRDADIDLSDIPEIRDFTAAVRGRFYRPVKQQITIRLDADVLAWFRALGGKYQTRINAALREYMDGHGDRE